MPKGRGYGNMRGGKLSSFAKPSRGGGGVTKVARPGPSPSRPGMVAKPIARPGPKPMPRGRRGR